jgi:hypothetical protein
MTPNQLMRLAKLLAVVSMILWAGVVVLVVAGNC